MDSSSTKDVWYFADQLWSSLVVALAVYGGGLTVASVMRVLFPMAAALLDGKASEIDLKLPLLFRLWYATRVAHPFFVGAACAFVPGLPHPDWVSSQTSAVLWFAFVGMGNGQIHMIVEQATSIARKYGETLAKRRLGIATSTPPPAAPAPALAVVRKVDSTGTDEPPPDEAA